MVNLREAALTYEAPETKVISDLPRVSVDIDLVQKTFKEGTPEQFTVDIATVDGEEYRVPKSVISQLQKHLEEIPALRFFKVKKTGSGMNTEYTVIPLVSE